RPELLEFCKHQVSRMNLKPDKHYIIDYPPKDATKDLVPRLLEGIRRAQKDGFDYAFVIEDDDAYPSDYFEKMYHPKYDIVGDDYTMYYHISNNGYHEQNHPHRASLFTTGFRISSLAKIALPMGSVFADIEIWNYAKRNRLLRKFVNSGAVGIKHGIGVVGGIGHRQKYRKFDHDWSVLASKVDSDALQFYKDLQRKLNG